MTTEDYLTHRIPKRDGSMRVIHEPKPELKRKQKGILRWLAARGIRSSWYSHGFARGRSTASNAAKHVGKKVVLKVDIKDFFGTITKQMVISALRREGLERAVTDDIAETCTLDGALPQGAPTSPFLANLAAKEMDYRLAGLARKFNAGYTRYADDLTFSSDNERLNAIMPGLDCVVRKCGYELNRKKTRIMRSGRRQTVTGLVVNEKLNVPRKIRKYLRGRLHKVKMDLIHRDTFDEKAFDVLRGHAAYVLGVSREHGAVIMKDIREIEHLQMQRARLVA